MPDGHNPLGTNLSAGKRQRLVELAHHYHLPIIEDDPYGLLAYDGPSLPPLRAIDDQWVYYVGSFSKVLAPALRVEWLIAPEALMSRLSATKEATDLDTTTFTQHIVSAFLDSAYFPLHLQRLQQEYRQRRETMHESLLNAFSLREARWHKPANGLFFWVEFMRSLDTTLLLEKAITTARVAFIPGPGFCARHEPYAAHCVRLNFSSHSPEHIQEGIRRLAQIINEKSV